MVTAVCLHGDVKLFLETIRTPQIFSGHSQCYAHLLPAGLETRGFAALLSPLMRLFNLNPPIKIPGNLTVTTGCSGCKFSPMLSTASPASLERCCASTGASPAAVITATVLSYKDRHSGYFCAISTAKTQTAGCSGCQCPRGSSSQLTEHLSGVRSGELRKAEIPPDVHMRSAACPVPLPFPSSSMSLLTLSR